MFRKHTIKGGGGVSRMEGRSVRSTERSEARNVATRSEA
jgi:hypothetical protein